MRSYALVGLLGAFAALSLSSTVGAQELLVLHAPVDFHKSLTHTVPFLFELYSLADDAVTYVNATFGSTENVEIPVLWSASRLDLAVNRDPDDVVGTTNLTVIHAVVCMGSLAAIDVWADSTNTTALCSGDAALYHVNLITSGEDVFQAPCEAALDDDECPVACDADATYNTATTTLCESVKVSSLMALLEAAISDASGSGAVDADQFFLLQMRWSKKVANVTTLYTGSAAFTIQASEVAVVAATVAPSSTFPIVLIIVIAGVFVLFAAVCAGDAAKKASSAVAQSGGAYAPVSYGK